MTDTPVLEGEMFHQTIHSYVAAKEAPGIYIDVCFYYQI